MQLKKVSARASGREYVIKATELNGIPHKNKDVLLFEEQFGVRSFAHFLRSLNACLRVKSGS